MQLPLLLIFVTTSLATSFITTQNPTESFQSRMESAEGTVQSRTETPIEIIQPRTETSIEMIQPNTETSIETIQPRTETSIGTIQPRRESRKGTIQPRRESRKGTIQPRRESRKGTIQPMRSRNGMVQSRRESRRRKIQTTTTESTRSGFLCYECVAGECRNPFNKTCDDGLSCYTIIEMIERDRLLERKGCLTDAFLDLVICIQKAPWKEKQVTSCCKGDLCNTEEFPDYPPWWDPEWKPEINDTKEELKSEGIDLTLKGIIVPSLIGVSLTLVLITVFVIIVACKWPNLLRCGYKPTCKNGCKTCVTSRSGSGSATLSQRCLSQDVTLIKCIGQGHYGKVWKGLWHGENVAVKVFSSKDEESWKNEVNIYTNISLYHENVLGFKGSVITTRFCVTEMWILSAFHEQGSLYDYLSKNTVTHAEAVQFAQSISAGLLHLHAIIICENGKPGIAHRDLKTKNILVTSHGTCVIADFGLAIVKCGKSSDFQPPVNIQVGTKRYMAPEILDQSMKINFFESYRRTDIYAIGLILWEICSRCTTEAAAYRPPFHDCVPSNPDFEDMKKVVCDELKRPEIPDRWSYDQILNGMASLMKECWHRKPDARCKAFRVKKCLDKLCIEIKKIQSTVEAA